MSFLLRAALVIGALSYLAMLRGQPGSPAGEGMPDLAAMVAGAPPAGEAAQATGASGRLGGLAAAWSAMPADARQRIVRAGVAELGRQAGAMAAVSRDTLAETDRKVPWRGTEPR